MTIFVGLGGLVLGVVLNWIIARQLRDVSATAPTPAAPARWYERIGFAPQPVWLALLVCVITALMAIVLWQDYGFAPRFWLLLAATLVLIDTAVIDWQVKLIDTLIMVGATLVAVICAPWMLSSWISAVLGTIAVGIVFILLFIIAKILYPHQAAPFGLGDVYLGMFIGALVGLYNVGYALFYGMMLAGLASLMVIVMLGYKRARHTPIAYGAFLCLGVLVYLLIRPDQL